ncbi:MAG: sigma-54-dependent transcriptional regulator [Planctomycetota bacterium]|jgi:two-component system nitrogen regulation response regulator NtrX
MAGHRILIVDDQAAVREELAYALSFEGFETVEAKDGEAALAAAGDGDFAVVLLDIKMPGLDGMQVLSQLRKDHPSLPVVMISGHGDIETAVVAVKQGAYDFLPKPFDTDRVLVSVNNALRLRDLTRENRNLRSQLAREHQILGESEGIQEIHRIIERVAPTEAAVLITGENGTGKELVARQLHARSDRGQGPFVAVNCAAIPSELIESELFGHEKGAFTGAAAARPGHFEVAHGGTLFLDEVGDMAMPAQAKLLRSLQEKVVTRVGGSKEIPVDVRVVAATNQDLQAMVEQKEFREDLFYRLHVIRVHVPALRERRGDIKILANHFLAEAVRQNGLPARKLAKDAIATLEAQSWPGNVRELKNLIEGAAILAEGEEIRADELKSMTAAGRSPVAAGADFFGLDTLEQFKAASEREFIRRKLDENNNNIKRTAERIQIQRSNLYKKLDRYGLK